MFCLFQPEAVFLISMKEYVTNAISLIVKNIIYIEIPYPYTQKSQPSALSSSHRNHIPHQEQLPQAVRARQKKMNNRTFLVTALLVDYDGVEAHGEGADRGVSVQKRSSKARETCVVFWYEGL